MKRKFSARLANLLKERKAVLLLSALPVPVGFLLFWFSMWLHLILFIGGYIWLFLLALKMEKLQRESGKNDR